MGRPLAQGHMNCDTNVYLADLRTLSSCAGGETVLIEVIGGSSGTGLVGPREGAGGPTPSPPTPPCAPPS